MPYRGMSIGWAAGSFCHFGNGSKGGEDGGGLGLELSAEGAVGLEGAELAEATEVGALETGVVAGEAGEGPVAGVVGEAVVRASGEVGFEAADTAEVPGRVEELSEEVLLEGALGLEVVLEGGLEELEFLAFVGSDHQIAGVQAVLEGVLGGAGLALGGAGSGGKLGVCDVGCLLGLG